MVPTVMWSSKVRPRTTLFTVQIKVKTMILSTHVTNKRSEPNNDFTLRFLYEELHFKIRITLFLK